MSTFNVNFSEASINNSSIHVGDRTNIPSEQSLCILQDAFVSGLQKLAEYPEYQDVLKQANRIAHSGNENALISFLKKHAGAFTSDVVTGALGNIAATIISSWL